MLANPYWRDLYFEQGWRGHDKFIDELRRTVYPNYAWNAAPKRGRDDPLVEWSLATRRLKYDPLPPEHPANQPETIVAHAIDPGANARDSATCPR